MKFVTISIDKCHLSRLLIQLSHCALLEIMWQIKQMWRDFLAEPFKGYSNNYFGWSKEIWDVVATAYLLNADWAPSNLVASPIIA